MKKTKTKLKVNDIVAVRAGNDKGKTGKIIALDKKSDKVLVEGVNIKTFTIKKTSEKPGELVKKSAFMHISNVGILDTETKKPSRIGYKVEGDKKVRISKQSGKTL